MGRDPKARERRALVRAIVELPPECRDIFVLKRFTGMSLDQIVEHLGLDREVAEARLAAALVQLCRAVDGRATTRS
nr:sigma factor-like helix-turn-helix DNA-binding protein [Brevundimonas sp. BAL450]